MGGNQTTVNTTDDDLLSYPEVDGTANNEEIAAAPTQQVGFVPQKVLEVKSQPIQQVATDAEKSRAELLALMQKQKVTTTPASSQTVQVKPKPAENIPTQPSVEKPAAIPVVESTPTQPEKTAQTLSTEARGEKLEALAEKTREVTEPVPTVETEPEVKQPVVEPVTTELPAQAVPVTQPQVIIQPTIPQEQITQSVTAPISVVLNEPVTGPIPTQASVQQTSIPAPEKVVQQPQPVAVVPEPTVIVEPTPATMPPKETVQTVQPVWEETEKPPSASELRGQKLAALAAKQPTSGTQSTIQIQEQQQTTPIPQTPAPQPQPITAIEQPVVQPTIPTAQPIVTATPEIPEPTETELEVGPMATRVQPYTPTKTPSLVPKELPTLPFAEVEKEPATVEQSQSNESGNLEARIESLESKIDQLIAQVNQWV